MRISVLASDDVLFDVRKSARGHEVVRTETPTELAAVFRKTDVVVLEVEWVRRDAFVRIGADAGAFGVALILYLKPLPAPMLHALDVPPASLVGIVLTGSEPRGLRRMIESGAAPTADVLAVRALHGALRQLPPRLAAAMIQLFLVIPVGLTVDDVARAAGMSRRSVERWSRRVGLRSAGAVIDGARLTRAWVEMTSDRDLSSVSPRTSDRSLRHLFGRVLGTPPRTTLRRVRTEEFVEGLSRWLLQPLRSIADRDDLLLERRNP